jgi:hypothetical protein
MLGFLSAPDFRTSRLFIWGSVSRTGRYKGIGKNPVLPITAGNLPLIHMAGHRLNKLAADGLF